MSRDERSFLRRWSRLKRQPTAQPETSEPPPELPSLESLNFESDFAAFMHAQVDSQIRRAALKTLFRHPRFNVMDGLDVYIDDYSIEDPIPPSVLAQLQHAQTTLFGPAAEDKTKDKAKKDTKPEEDAGTQQLTSSSNVPASDGKPESSHDRAHEATVPP